MIRVTFKFANKEVEKIMRFAKTKSNKTWDKFLNSLFTSHPSYKEFEQKYKETLAPWELEKNKKGE